VKAWISTRDRFAALRRELPAKGANQILGGAIMVGEVPASEPSLVISGHSPDRAYRVDPPVPTETCHIPLTIRQIDNSPASSTLPFADIIRRDYRGRGGRRSRKINRPGSRSGTGRPGGIDDDEHVPSKRRRRVVC
jgi:hypothetical protein